MSKALLFVNGEKPNHYPKNLTQYKIIACTDGAYQNYLHETQIIPHVIVGDLDSMHDHQIDPYIQVVYTPDQSKTDFEKTLLYLAEQGIKQFDIYGATGRASDHFLGNISVAMRYYQQWQLTFYDNYCQFYFIQHGKLSLNNMKGKTISLIPLSPVKQLTICGFEYPLNQADLSLNGLTSLRNKAIADEISVQFSEGDLMIFIS